MEYAFMEQDYLGGEANTLNHRPEKPLPGECNGTVLYGWIVFGRIGKKPGKLRRPVLRMKNFGIFTKNVGIEMELSLGILEYIRMVHWRKKRWSR